MQYLGKRQARGISITILCLLCPFLCPLLVGGQMMQEMEVPLLIRTVINKVDIILGKMEGMELKMTGFEEKQKSTDAVLEDLKEKMVDMERSTNQDGDDLKDLIEQGFESTGAGIEENQNSSMANFEDLKERMVDLEKYINKTRADLRNFISYTTCRSPFSNVGGIGCIHIVTDGKTFEESRRHCQSLGGDLFVASSPEHYLRLAQHFIDTDYKAIRKYMWVGVKEGNWFNGRRVAPEEEAPGNPAMGKDRCSYTDGDTSEKFLLWTDPCDNNRGSICELNALSD